MSCFEPFKTRCAWCRQRLNNCAGTNIRAKRLDKLETIIQHNQGANPPDFYYAFNLADGQKYTAANPVLATIRALVDKDTLRLAQAGRPPTC